MGCNCCRMLKSYIYDPSVAVDVRKADSAANSLYQPHHLPGSVLSDLNKQKQGFNNMGYSKSNNSTLKLEMDNNHVNHRMHAAPAVANELHRQASAPPAEGGLYIIQPQALGPRWVMQERGPSQVPVYPDVQEYKNQRGYSDRGRSTTRDGWDSSITECVIGRESLSVDEIDEGVGGTPEYPCDTGDECSILSVEIHTSTTSLSSAEGRDGLRPPNALDASTVESGISVAKSEDEEVRSEEEPRSGDEEELHSVTDSMVAEALAALEAATAGEDFE